MNKKGDPFYSDRNDVEKHDIAIYNILNQVVVALKTADLIKEAIGPDKIMIEQKSIGLFETFFSSFKKGLICT